LQELQSSFARQVRFRLPSPNHAPAQTIAGAVCRDDSDKLSRTQRDTRLDPEAVLGQIGRKPLVFDRSLFRLDE